MMKFKVISVGINYGHPFLSHAFGAQETNSRSSNLLPLNQKRTGQLIEAGFGPWLKDIILCDMNILEGKVVIPNYRGGNAEISVRILLGTDMPLPNSLSIQLENYIGKDVNLFNTLFIEAFAKLTGYVGVPNPMVGNPDHRMSRDSEKITQILDLYFEEQKKGSTIPITVIYSHGVAMEVGKTYVAFYPEENRPYPSGHLFGVYMNFLLPKNSTAKPIYFIVSCNSQDGISHNFRELESPVLYREGLAGGGLGYTGSLKAYIPGVPILP